MKIEINLIGCESNNNSTYEITNGKTKKKNTRNSKFRVHLFALAHKLHFQYGFLFKPAKTIHKNNELNSDRFNDKIVLWNQHKNTE